MFGAGFYRAAGIRFGFPPVFAAFFASLVDFASRTRMIGTDSLPRFHFPLSSPIPRFPRFPRFPRGIPHRIPPFPQSPPTLHTRFPRFPQFQPANRTARATTAASALPGFSPRISASATTAKSTDLPRKPAPSARSSTATARAASPRIWTARAFAAVLRWSPRRFRGVATAAAARWDSRGTGT